MGALAPVFDLLCASYAEARSRAQHARRAGGGTPQLPAGGGALGGDMAAMLPVASPTVSPSEVHVAAGLAE